MCALGDDGVAVVPHTAAAMQSRGGGAVYAPW